MINDGLSYLKKAYLIRKKEFGENNNLTLTSQSLYGKSLLDAGRFVEAEKQLVESFNGLSKIFGNEKEATQNTLLSIVELYKEQRKKDKAEYYSNLIVKQKN